MQMIYDISSLEDVCEDMLDYDLPEIFEGDIDNFEILRVVIEEHVISQDEDREYSVLVNLFEGAMPLVTRDQYEDVASEILSLKSMVNLLNDISRSVVSLEIDEAKVDVRNNRLVISTS